MILRKKPHKLEVMWEKLKPILEGLDDSRDELAQVLLNHPELQSKLAKTNRMIYSLYDLALDEIEETVSNAELESNRNAKNATLIDLTKQDIIDEWAALVKMGTATKTNLAAKLWNMSRTTLNKKLKEFGLTYSKKTGIVDPKQQ